MTAPACSYARFRPQSESSAGIPLGARSVGHHRVESGWVDDPFEISHVVVFWGIQGTGQIYFPDRCCPLPPDHIAVLLPGMSQRIEAGKGEWEYCWWTMDGPFAVDLTAGFGFEAGVRRVGPAPLDQIFRLDQKIRRPGRVGEMDASACAYRLLATAAQARRTFGASRLDPLLAKVEALVEERWDECGFGVDGMAKELGIHRSTLSRHFKSTTGSTLISHLTSVRLQHAMNMLSSSTDAIAEIAEACGFGDAGYFNRVFKQQIGVTPGQFRSRR